MTSAMRIKQMNMNDSQCIVVEFREKSSDSFAFKFKKGEKVTIGVCEWC